MQLTRCAVQKTILSCATFWAVVGLSLAPLAARAQTSCYGQLAEHLRACTPHSCLTLNPIQPVPPQKQEIVGLQQGSCAYLIHMEAPMQISCLLSQVERESLAHDLELWGKYELAVHKRHVRTVESDPQTGEEATKTTLKIDGEDYVLNGALDRALEAGSCRFYDTQNKVYLEYSAEE
ncbi:MAG: hypothetical protein EOM37_06025 [Proteobacteria bacterium]|jgi:hypothetical protein|nr:hypothetical protein [Alphaproteobacteria bacterium]NCC03587.1 hypothetical protein [Pseudomonadota bacterium]